MSQIEQMSYSKFESSIAGGLLALISVPVGVFVGDQLFERGEVGGMVGFLFAALMGLGYYQVGTKPGEDGYAKV